MSVRLRPLQPLDADAGAEWLRAIAMEIGVGAPRAGALTAVVQRDEARAIEVDGEPAGLVAWKLRGGDAWLVALALKPPWRRRGRGMEAALLAEREMAAAGVVKINVPAPATHGIALYFWLRLGYRPLRRSDWPPCQSDEPVAWLARDLEPAVADEGGSHERR